MRSRVLVPLVLGVVAALMVAPLLLTLGSAFAAEGSEGIRAGLTLDHVARVWTEGGFSRYFVNSLVISVVDAILMIAVASLAAYALTFIDFPGRGAIRLLFLAGLMIPVTAIALPLYSTVRAVGLLNSPVAVILSDVALALPIFVFLYASFFRGLPPALHDAARIDGAGEMQIFRFVVLPLARPVTVTTGLLEFLWSWNDLLLRLLFLPGERSRTLSVGLLLFQGGQTRDIHGLSAGAVLMSLPVILLFVAFQRHFVRGMTAGAVK